jgi:ribosomal protein S18 acetylase RimI-like enzyme
VEYATDKAKEMGYSEMSIGVDLDNYPALKLYADSGFDKILFIGEDHQGKYVKLLKEI